MLVYNLPVVPPLDTIRQAALKPKERSSYVSRSKLSEAQSAARRFVLSSLFCFSFFSPFDSIKIFLVKEREERGGPYGGPIWGQRCDDFDCPPYSIIIFVWILCV